MNIGGVEIGPAHPCRFVAEISNNHNGSLNRAIRLIDAAKAAGADFVKTQCYTPDELVALRGDGPAPEPWGAQGWTMRTLYEKARTPLEWFPELFQHARDIGIVPFASVFGPESLPVLEAVGCEAYKIAALDNAHADLIIAAKRTGKPVLVSMRLPERSVESLDGFPSVHCLYCPPGYPTAVADVQLPQFGASYLGLSSHCLAPELPIAAVARGCKLIEMHLQLAKEPSELEANVSLTEVAFRDMIEAVRRTEVMFG